MQLIHEYVQKSIITTLSFSISGVSASPFSVFHHREIPRNGGIASARIGNLDAPEFFTDRSVSFMGFCWMANGLGAGIGAGMVAEMRKAVANKTTNPPRISVDAESFIN
jgi:ribose 1,5-bisphosphokinase PhnN